MTGEEPPREGSGPAIGEASAEALSPLRPACEASSGPAMDASLQPSPDEPTACRSGASVTGLRIAHVALPLPIQLSPLASISTPAFRILCEEQGCGLTWTEMVSVPGLVRWHPKIAALIRRSQPGRPFAVQLVGARPEEMEEAARQVAALGAELIDLNMGCPVKKVAKTGGGVALMRTPDLAEALVRAALRGALRGAFQCAGERSAAPAPVAPASVAPASVAPAPVAPPSVDSASVDPPPVAITVKMRLGWDHETMNAPELALRLVEAGCRAVTVHGRTRQAGFTGEVDLAGIRQVVEAVGHRAPVFGNGDVVDAASYRRMRQETGCAGVMIGRAALGNPWVFRELAAAERGGPLPPPASAEDRIAAMRRHLRLSLDDASEMGGLPERRDLPEKVIVTEIRKHLIWYSRGLAGSVPFRRQLQTTSTLAEVEEAMSALAERQAESGFGTKHADR